jgi:3-(3-hydroxy-phenyl)propionate hydroxylase
MRAFRHGRTLFVGDAAHLVSPFGARGANSGIQDVDNLVWKLALVMEGAASETLLDSFDIERMFAADENIRASTRSTEFITPKHAASRLFRDAALSLAGQHPFARALVNSGRLSVPAVLADSPLSTADADNDRFAGVVALGGCAADAPVAGPRPAPDGEWLLGYLDGFTLLIYDSPLADDAFAALPGDTVDCAMWRVAAAGEAARSVAGRRVLVDCDGLLMQRYDARPGSCYLFRPDQHLCARWRQFDAAAVRSALAHASAASARVAALEVA